MNHGSVLFHFLSSKRYNTSSSILQNQTLTRNNTKTSQYHGAYHHISAHPVGRSTRTILYSGDVFSRSSELPAWTRPRRIGVLFEIGVSMVLMEDGRMERSRLFDDCGVSKEGFDGEGRWLRAALEGG